MFRSRVVRQIVAGLSILAMFLSSSPRKLLLADETSDFTNRSSIIHSASAYPSWDLNTLTIYQSTDVDINIYGSDNGTPVVSAALDSKAKFGTFAFSVISDDGFESIHCSGVVEQDGQLIYQARHADLLTAMFSNAGAAAWAEADSEPSFWEGYWYYLTNPSAMDDDLETGFYVSGGLGVGAGALAGGIAAAPVVAATTFTIPTFGVTTTMTGGISGGGLVLGGTTMTVTTSTITVTGTQVVTTAVIGGTTVLMSVDPNKLNHIFNKAEHHLGDFLSGFGGNQELAFETVKNATQAVIDATGQTAGLIDDIIVNVGGTNIVVRGKVIDGIVRIGTFFIIP